MMSMTIAFTMVFFMIALRTSNNSRLMTGNMFTVVILLMSFITNSVDNLLTLLDVDDVNNLLASSFGDLARVLMGMLVTLLLLLVLALRTSVVSMISRVSSTLVIVSTMTIVILVVLTNNSGVMSNNTRVMVAGLLFFMTVSSGYILALFDVGDINNYFIVNITLLMLLLLWYFVTLLVLLIMTMWTIVLLVFNVSIIMASIGGTINKSSREKKD